MVRTTPIALLFVLVAACVHQPSAVETDVAALPAPRAQGDSEDIYWWYARFKMDWEDDKRPDFSQNLIIAREIVAPVLAGHADDIALWRFHRRAAYDDAGHQFSFIFYSTPAAAAVIYADIQANPLVDALLASGDLLELKLDDPARPSRPGISGTSDGNWPRSVQNSWPYFIMGVSLMWLDLLEQTVAADELAARPRVSDRLAYYRDVEKELTRVWREFGRHALFHHISGIYGYKPLEIRF